jgi:hypothetical protein
METINPKYALFALEWEPKVVAPQDLTVWRNGLRIDVVEVLYVYGLGDGGVYHQFAAWLRENGERRLVILEEDTGLIAAALRAETLNDPQVSLEWLDGSILQELAEKYPVEAIEVIALPGKEGAKFRSIRLQLLRKTSLTHSLFVDRFHGSHLFDNFIQNIPHLEHAFYANGLNFSQMPAIICGAGPSLAKDIELLKQLENKVIIIAGGSAIAALTSAGVEPHFAIAIDPNVEEFHRMQNSFAFECPFLFSTRVHPGVFQTCNGPFGYLRSGIGGMPELWIEEELGLTGPLLGEHLSDEAISVTAIAQAFAQYIGCKTILLSGVDLAYTDGRRYAPGVAQEVPITEQLLRRKDKKGNFVKTALRWVMEAASLSHYAKKHPEIRWINTTAGGLPIKGFETMDLAAASKLFTQEWDLQTLIAEQIGVHPMPKPKQPLLPQLADSLSRVIGHLEILAGEKQGAKSLAELEMKEELAFSILFYDMEKVIAQARMGGSKWTQFLEKARTFHREMLKRSLTSL